MHKRVKKELKKRKNSSKKNEKGLSTIVATLLIILLTLVAVGIIWVVIRNVLNSGSEQVSLGKFTLNLEIKNVAINVTGNSSNVTIVRNSGEGEISGLIFIFDDGENTESVEVNESLSELEQRIIQIKLVPKINMSKIQKVSVAPIFLLKSGKESIGDVKDEYAVDISKATTCTPNCAGLSCGIDPVCGQSCGTCTLPLNCVSGTCVDSSLKANNATCTLDSECQSGNCDYDIFTQNTVEGHISTGTSKYCHASASKCFFYVGYGDENNVGCTRCGSWPNGGVWDDFIDTCGVNSQWVNYIDCTGSTPKCNASSASGSCNVNCVQCNSNSDCSVSLPSCVNNVCTTQASIIYFQNFEGSFVPTGWKTGGNSNWYKNATAGFTVNGSAAAVSGVISNSQKSWINYTSTFAVKGYVSFYWNVSSEANYDFLCFCQDKDCGAPGCDCAGPNGNADARISSITDGTWISGFVNQTFTIGTHFFTWCYATDSGTLSGKNMGIMDNVTFTYRA